MDLKGKDKTGAARKNFIFGFFFFFFQMKFLLSSSF